MSSRRGTRRFVRNRLRVSRAFHELRGKVPRCIAFELRALTVNKISACLIVIGCRSEVGPCRLLKFGSIEVDDMIEYHGQWHECRATD